MLQSSAVACDSPAVYISNYGCLYSMLSYFILSLYAHMNCMFIIKTQLQLIHEDMMQLVLLKHKKLSTIYRNYPFSSTPINCWNITDILLQSNWQCISHSCSSFPIKSTKQPSRTIFNEDWMSSLDIVFIRGYSACNSYFLNLSME